MSTVAATVNAAPAYFVNDLVSSQGERQARQSLCQSQLSGVGVVVCEWASAWDFFIESINDIMQWIFGALFGGYAAANLAQVALVAIQ